MHISWKAMSAKRDCSRRHLMMIENTALKGTVNMVLRGPDGRVKAHKTIRNKVMNAGIAHIVGRMIDPNQCGMSGDHTWPDMMRFMGIGTGTTKNIGSTGTGTLNALVAGDGDDTGGGNKSVFRAGYDLESGGFAGSEYKLENEVTGLDSNSTPQDPGHASTKKLNGRIDMAHFEYTSGKFGTLGASAAGPQALTAGVAGTAITRELTTDLYQGFVNANNSLTKSVGTVGNTAEGTRLEDVGTKAAQINRITSFTNLEGFVGGYVDYAGWATSNTGYPDASTDPKYTASAAHTARRAAALSTQKKMLEYWNGNGSDVSAADLANAGTTIAASVTYAETAASALTLGSYASGQKPVHVGGSAAITTNTTLGSGSPKEKRHQRAVYGTPGAADTKKLGDRLVFIALFPPNSPDSTIQIPVTEAGIFNNAVSGQSAQTMLCRTVFAVVTKQPEDSLQITWSIAFQDSTPVAG